MTEYTKVTIQKSRSHKAEKKTSEKPLISVVIPVYNTAKFISECLDSLLIQNYHNLEIICVDDGSTDSSAAIIRHYMAKDKRIKYIYQKNQGQSVARNNGMQQATGKYVMFLDSDDKLIYNAVLQCVETVLSKKVDIVLFNMEMFLPSGEHFPCFTGPLFENPYPILFSEFTEIAINFTNAATGFFDLDIIREHNITFPEGMIYEDWVFMTHLMTSGNYKIFWLNTPLYWYRRDFAQSTTSNITRKCLDLLAAYKMANEYLSATPDRNKQLYINDYKIVNEAVGFFLSRIVMCSDESIVVDYLKGMLDIFSGFTYTYLLCLCNNLTRERRSFALSVYDLISKSPSEADLIAFFRKYSSLDTVNTRKPVKDVSSAKSEKPGMTVIIRKIYAGIKKILRSMLPSYRVSLDVREKVERMNNELISLNTRVNSISCQLNDISRR